MIVIQINKKKKNSLFHKKNCIELLLINSSILYTKKYNFKYPIILCYIS